MPLQIYDTLHRRLEPAQPMDGSTFRFYCCGPTVYGPAHIGNFRTFAVQDTFRRVLELGGTPTLHVRNLTDVDDKTIRRSIQENKTLAEVTNYWRDYFHADCKRLNMLPPHVEPSAVEHIPHQIRMIEELMAKGHAYAAADGSVYFKISSFEQYGRLSHLDTRELKIGSTVDSDEYEKEGVADFVLWKSRKPEDGANHWESPWGQGRPGWHLECSAMTRAYLGDTFDLHSGGVDLIFPHHENEIAQSECCTGQTFSKLWFHVNHLLVDGAKMAKSLGNLYTLADLADKGHSATRVRYVLLSAHYRTPLNFTLSSLDAAKQALEKILKYERALAKAAGASEAPGYPKLLEKPEIGPYALVQEAMENDLNTPEALGRIFTNINRFKVAELSTAEAKVHYLGLHFSLALLGLDLTAEAAASPAAQEAPPDVLALAEERWAARSAKNWAESDRLRAAIDALGWTMKDGKQGYELESK
jgi:cysteinyl-tRNA synthetase